MENMPKRIVPPQRGDLMQHRPEAKESEALYGKPYMFDNGFVFTPKTSKDVELLKDYLYNKKMQKFYLKLSIFCIFMALLMAIVIMLVN